MRKAIQAVYDTYKKPGLQIIVVDNNSSDDSVKMVKKEFPKVEIVQSNTNTGFAKGNNLARPITKGEIVLFLNPDTEVKGKAIEANMKVLESEKDLGAITCKVQLPNGQLDYSCHRGLPTVWNTFCYMMGMAKLFPGSPTFAGYTATYLDINTIHDIDCITGAYLMIKRKALDKIGWWDEDYWWNGDDIEFCYKVKQAGFKIRYDPRETMMHFKGASSGLYNNSKVALTVPKETKVRSAKSATKAMRIFIKKHWNELGPWPVMAVVWMGIFLLEQYRLWKIDQSYK